MTWSVHPPTPAVAIYREMLVNYNEPFILALGEALDEAKLPREKFAALKPGQVFEI